MLRSHGARRRRLGYAIDAAVVLVLALVVLLVGLPAPLGRALFVQANGRAAAITPGTRLSDVAQSRSLAPRHGASVDIAGDVLAFGEGEAGSITLGGKATKADPPLTDGTIIVARRGRDLGETLSRRLDPVPYRTRTEGSGAVLALVQKGMAGEREVYSGSRSRRTVLARTTREPVAAVLRRSSGLSKGQKAVALTFDDGPSTYTPAVLSVLKDKGVSATFFMIGRAAAGNKREVAAVRAAGHELESHSWSHADLTKLSADAVRQEIVRGAAAVGGARFLRPPYGAYNDMVAEQAGLAGLRLALWNVDTLDWKVHDAAAILAKVKAGAKPGTIILMHDGGGDRSQTVAALPTVIDWLLQQGYALTTLQRLVP
jgi:peptidoglycan-N-acetylglucosamine deacetylase